MQTKCLSTCMNKTRSKQRQLSGIFGPFDRRILLCFDHVLVALIIKVRYYCLQNMRSLGKIPHYTYGICDFPRVLLRDPAYLLQNEIEAAAVHVLHAYVYLAVAKIISFRIILGYVTL